MAILYSTQKNHVFVPFSMPPTPYWALPIGKFELNFGHLDETHL